MTKGRNDGGAAANLYITASDRFGTGTYTIRSAGANDLDAITRVAIESWEYDEQWSYRFPLRKKYPEDHWKFTRALYAAYLGAAQSGDVEMNVVELEGEEIVAVSIWQLPGTHMQPANAKSGKEASAVRPLIISNRRDANADRVSAYRNAGQRAKHEHFDSRYGERQLYLCTLIVHPDYFRRGYGSALMDLGLERAKRERLAVTMSASERGVLLYGKLGFKKVADFLIQVEGEEEKLVLPVMALEFGDDLR